MAKHQVHKREKSPIGLSFQIMLEWREADAVDFRALLNRAFTVSKDGNQSASMKVVLGDSAYRIDAVATQSHHPSKSNVSAIRHHDGRMLWLDHATRRVAHADEKKLPKQEVHPSMRCLVIPEVLKGDAHKKFLATLDRKPARDSQIVRTVLRDAFTRCDWQHYFICDPSRRVSPAVLKTLLALLAGNRDLMMQSGFPWDHLLKVVNAAGLPISGGIVPLDRTATTRTGSAFNLQDVKVRPVRVGEFASPPDYGQVTPGSSDEPAGPQIRMAPDPNGGPGGGRIHVNYPSTEGDGPPISFTSSGRPSPHGAETVILGLYIPQSALDSIRNTVNEAVLPFSKFAISAGTLTIDWLAQMRADWVSRNGGGGTMLYCALHDDTLPAAGAPIPAPCSTFTGKGRLDAQAKKVAENLVNMGGLPASIVAALPAAAAMEFATVGANWSGLSSSTQMLITCQVLWQTMAAIQIPVGGPIDEDLAIDNAKKVKLAKVSGHLVSGTVSMPPVTRSTAADGTTIIESRNVVTRLMCRDDATIEADVTLGEIDLFAQFQVTPTDTFWEIVGIGHLASLLFPPLAALTTHAATLAIELLAQGTNSLTVSITKPKVVCTVAFRQKSTGVFVPVIDASITAAGFSFAVGLPPTSLAGVFEALQFAFQGWVYRAIFPTISQMVTDRIYLLLSGVLGGGFPASVSNLKIPIIGGMAAGQANDHTYMEVWLDKAPGSNPVLAPLIAMDGNKELVADVTALNAGPTQLRGLEGAHCLSLNISQNALNVILAARMLGPFFPLGGGITQGPDLSTLAALAQAPVLTSFFQWVFLSPLTAPNITLSPAPDPLYATMDAKFSLSALSIDPISAGLGSNPGATWTFRVSSPVKIVLGSSTPENGGMPTPIVDINLFPNHIFDLLFDIDQCLITLETMSVDPGGTGTSPLIPITPTISSQQEPVIRAALKIICGKYGLSRQPARDGIGLPMGVSPASAREDLPLEQTYTLDGSDPDNGGNMPVLEVPVALGLHPQLLHMHVQLAGALVALLDGTISLGASSSNCAFGKKLQ